MDCVARREEFPALAKLFVDSFGGTEQFAMSVLESFAGEGNVFAARQDGCLKWVVTGPCKTEESVS